MASLSPEVATYMSVVNMSLLALYFWKKFHGLSPESTPWETFHSLTSLTLVLFKYYVTRSSIYSPKYCIIISLCRNQDFKISEGLKDTGLFSPRFQAFSICLCFVFRLFCPTAGWEVFFGWVGLGCVFFFLLKKKPRGSEFHFFM